MLQLQIENCNKDNAEQIVEFLEECEALSVTMLDQNDDPILEPELGTMPLWPCVIINALFDSSANFDVIKEFLDNNYISIKYSIDVLPEQDWEKVCLDNFKPKQIGDRLLICPSWITPVKQDIPTLTLDPGLAFGTGSHETTELCLAWLEKNDLNDKNIIDYGCGSGILGLSALKLGAEHVYALDIDEQALIATKNNAITNNIPPGKLTILQPEVIDCKADIILANILLKTLISLKQDFLSLLNKKGIIITSGILVTQVEELINAFSPEFNLISVDKISDWAMLVFNKALA